MLGPGTFFAIMYQSIANLQQTGNAAWSSTIQSIEFKLRSIP